LTVSVTGLADPIGPNVVCAFWENPLGRPRPQACSNEVTVRTTGVPVLRKTVVPGGTVSAGGLLTYTVSWSNAGVATIAALTITDTLPDGTTVVSPSLAFWGQPDGMGAPSLVSAAWSTALGGPWVSGEPPGGSGTPLFLRWVVDRVVPGASGFLRFRAGISGTLAEGATVTNAASATQLFDPGVYRSPPVTTIVSHLAILLTKTPSGWSLPAGGSVTYTIDYSNASIDTAVNVTVWDTVPPGLVFGSATGGGVLGGTVVTWSVPGLSPGGVGTVQFTAVADGSQTLIGPNRAALECRNSALVPQTPTVSPPVSLHLTAPVLALVKQADVSVAPAGALVTYTIGVANTGDDTAMSLGVLDTLPAGGTYVSCGGGSSCGFNGTRVLWTLGDLAPAATTSVSCTLRFAAAGLFTNTASGRCANSIGVSCPPVASPPVTVQAIQAVLALDIQASHTRTGRCTLLDYTIGVRNTGGDTATAIAVWDTLPAGTAWAGCTGGLSCGPAGPLVVFTLGPLGPGRSTSVAFTVSVTGSGVGPGLASGVCANSVGAARPVVVSNTVSVLVGSPQVSVTVWAASAVVAAGDPVLFTVQVRNSGTDAARNISVWDTLPAGASFVSASGGGVVTGSVLTWSRSVLGPGASESFLLTLQSGFSCTVPELAFGASLDAADNCLVALPRAGAARVHVGVASLAVTLSKSATPSVGLAGSPVTYRLTWANACTDTLWNARVWDTLPAGLVYTGCSGGTGCGVAGGLVVWTLPPVPPGTAGSATVFTLVPVSMTGDHVPPNRALLGGRTSSGPEMTPVPSNEVVVGLLGPRLVVTKVGPPSAPVEGPVEFQITVRNAGTDTAFAATMRDLVPPPLFYVSAVPPPSGVTPALTWTLGDLAPGGQVVVKVTLAGKKYGPAATAVNRAVADGFSAALQPLPEAVGEAAVVLESQFLVYPDPFDPKSAVRGTLKFANAPPGAKVRIYTTRGLRVWEGGPSSGFMIEWNGRNEGGRLVAPGLYLWVAEQGKWKRRGTIVVE
jgi:uncharacterized repeat protein (TIGR01451 family)